ncbi:uncharacterized protein LOC108253905 [Diaphorina citri]|uniref:Uncharacterized protein LOC108253905 n=1 Tax=Diaphorina citri TaxID=121845 RepID=A0A1S4EPV2_DIACI|nr:uncharacterized protein LOC108253905 [Diaphorina citri]
MSRLKLAKNGAEYRDHLRKHPNCIARIITKFQKSSELSEAFWFDAGFPVDKLYIESPDTIPLLKLYAPNDLKTACDTIREKLYLHPNAGSLLGSEWESIILTLQKLPDVCVGLRPLGMSITNEGVRTDLIYPPYPHALDEALLECEMLPPGQSKLYIEFFGFVNTRPIVYVGSSPGNGWLKALSILPNPPLVVSIDPRPLAGPHPHYLESLTTCERLNEILAENGITAFDLMWDVRGDYSDPEQYDKMVEDEIGIWNQIIQNVEGCVRLHNTQSQEVDTK